MMKNSCTQNKNDFYTWSNQNNKQLLKEWDYEKNEIDPRTIARGSTLKVWWKCDKGHSFESSLIKRTSRNQGCPYCSGKKILEGYNDLATTKPELLKEWDYEKNTEIKPTQVAKGSGKKVWWKCKYGHEWKSRISDRVYHESGCPFCTHAFQVSYPETYLFYFLKKEFDDCLQSFKAVFLGKMEYDIYIPSKKVAIEYDGANWHKNKKKNDIEKYKLAKTNGDFLIRVKEKELSTEDKNSDIEFLSILGRHKRVDDVYRDELNSILNSILDILGSNKKYRKEETQKYENEVLKISTSLIGEPLSNRKDLVLEWNYEKNFPLTPDAFSLKSSRKVWWKCKEGHEWQAVISSRTSNNYISKNNESSNGRGCPFCSGHKLLSGYNDLATKYPEIAEEWNYERNLDLVPSEVMPGVSKMVWWKCKEGHEWQAQIHNRTGNHTNCPICYRLKHESITSQGIKLRKRREIAKKTIFEISSENFSQTLNEINDSIVCLEGYKGIDAIYTFQCVKCSYTWNTTLRKYIESTRNCLSCSYKQRGMNLSLKKAADGNSLSELYPELAKEWSPRNDRPANCITPVSHKKSWWICKECGFEWQSSPQSRVRGSGCPACVKIRKSNKLKQKNTKSNENVLYYSRQNLMSEWDWENNVELDPKKISIGSHTKAWWKCQNCGNKWIASIKNRVNGSNCPVCSIDHRKKTSSKRKVIDEETGVIYDSLSKASKALNIPSTTLQRYCNSGNTRYNYYNEESNEKLKA